MQAVILAAGEGKRFRPWSNFHQKCMFPLYERPLLAYVLDNIARACGRDLTQFNIVVGYYENEVKQYFGDEYTPRDSSGQTWECPVPIRYVTQQSQFGTGDALYVAYTALRFREPVLVCLGDVIPNVKALDRLVMCDSENNRVTVFHHVCDGSDHARIETQETIDNSWPKRVTQAYMVGADGVGKSDYVDIGQWWLHPDTIKRMGEFNVGERRTLRCVQASIESGERGAVAFLSPT